MNLRSETARDALAAEYALGTLRGAARARFVRWMTGDADLVSRVHFWEQALQPMADGIAPVTPPNRVWQGISERLAFTHRAKSRLNWIGGAWATAALVLIVTSVLLWGPVREQFLFDPDIKVALADKNQIAIWWVEIDYDSDRLVVSSLRDTEVATDKSLELWLLRAGDLAPISLGLLPTQKGKAIKVSSPIPIRGGSGVAVSLEPSGGSPTGLPTGPVLYVRTFKQSV